MSPSSSPHPLLLQINTRVEVNRLSQQLGRPATLDDIDEQQIGCWQDAGYQWIWLLGVWQTGLASQQVSRNHPAWQQEYRETLVDLTEQDIGGSCFAIADYQVHHDLGGPEALAKLRQRLAQRGLKLMLDFVPNHIALDHPWVSQTPAMVINASEQQLCLQPGNYCRLSNGPIIAYGRDPHLPGWPDTAQLDYSQPAVQQAMMTTLQHIADQCDGVRCDMAMLQLPEVFARTWGLAMAPFWPQAIAQVKQHHPDFIFMAEVYWDMEWPLLQQGFDYAYDKRLYDRLFSHQAEAIHAHLSADLNYQRQLVRFIENHDEARVSQQLSAEQHRAAALIALTAPGCRFIHQGQQLGYRARITPHLIRGPNEPTDAHLAAFYQQLLSCLREPVMHFGDWQLCHCDLAWPDNHSCQRIIAMSWHQADEQFLVVVNYAADASQGYLRGPFIPRQSEQLEFSDLLSDACYVRDNRQLQQQGLYLDLPAWGYHLFQVSAKAN
ncbi:alpha-amylase [Neiella sp. HB171785]|uniref:Alpha-amylase n=1 Tax=Neiella litorisoli TaxID=2771431 RepID=A0A8J6UF28_9GAMM|nr:alpha-amylase family glycosyl hydrolase [Neiella litorisoli]MBD1390434.1 alpha-amylase [Neiella litorisoli]